MKRLVIQLTLLTAILTAGCVSTTFRAAPVSDITTQPAQFGTVAVQVWQDDEGDLYDDGGEVDPSESAVLFGDVSSRDVFRGTARKRAKISIAEAQVEEFGSLNDFLGSVPSDDDMIDRDISNSAHSGRTDEEMRNVRFPAFLFATNKPNDNDYHVIIGDESESPTLLMNVEISGLPTFPRDSTFTTQEDATRLGNVRRFYQSALGDHLPTGPYVRFFPGIPVEITGSIFYDTSHRPGQVGPRGLRPETSWEIHPITFIRFLEDVD